MWTLPAPALQKMTFEQNLTNNKLTHCQIYLNDSRFLEIYFFYFGRYLKLRHGSPPESLTEGEWLTTFLHLILTHKVWPALLQANGEKQNTLVKFGFGWICLPMKDHTDNTQLVNVLTLFSVGNLGTWNMAKKQTSHKGKMIDVQMCLCIYLFQWWRKYSATFLQSICWACVKCSLSFRLFHDNSGAPCNGGLFEWLSLQFPFFFLNCTKSSKYIEFLQCILAISYVC